MSWRALPARRYASTRALQLSGCFHVGQHISDPLSPHRRTILLYVRQAEFAFALLDGVAYQLRLGTFGLGHLANPLLEFLIGHFQNGKDVVDEWPWIVFSLVPTA